MLTTVCDAVSTNCWLRSAAASMCRLPSNAHHAARPVTTAATNTVANAISVTRVRCGCRRGGGAGLLTRTFTGFGASTTPVADDASPAAGPAARDARRRTGFDAWGAETVSSAITPALEPTSDQPS